MGTYLDETETFVRFFNPRKDRWPDHFDVLDGVIYPKTEIGKATVKIFQINKPDRVEIRQMLSEDGFYP